MTWRCELCGASGSEPTYKGRERALGQHLRDEHPGETS